MAGDHDPADHPQGGGGHAGHAHGVSADADTGKLSIALGQIVGFRAVEVAVGVLAHSLALLSDPVTCSPTQPRSDSPCSPRASPPARRRER